MTTRIRLSCAVWGDWHIEQFLTRCLPSLRAPGNLDSIDHHWSIHTRQMDAKRLARAMPNAVIHAVIADNESVDLRRAVALHTNCWLADAAAAERYRVAMILITPDVIYGEGTLARYAALMDDGAEIVHHVMHRVTAEEMPEINDWNRRALARLALVHEHERSRCYRLTSPQMPAHVECLSWDVADGRGLLVREIVNDCRAFMPGRVLFMPDNFIAINAPEMASIASSDEAIGLILTPRGKDQSWVTNGAPLSVQKARKTLRRFGSPYSEKLCRSSYRLVGEELPESTWTDAERDAEAIMDWIYGTVMA